MISRGVKTVGATDSASQPSPARGIRTGTQAIERSVGILRELAARGAAGWSLGSLAERCGLEPATAHRILRALREEGLVQQRQRDRHYLLGSLAFELGITMVPESHFQAAMRTQLRRLVRHTPYIVALGYLRSGDSCVCIAREGRSPYSRDGRGIRVGHMGPMLSLAGGVAILGALPAMEARSIIARNEHRLAHLPRGQLARMRGLALRSAGSKFVSSEGTIWQGIHSVAVAVARSDGIVVGALAGSTAPGMLHGPRLAQIVTRLQEATRGLRAAADRLSPDAGGFHRLDADEAGEHAT